METGQEDHQRGPGSEFIHNTSTGWADGALLHPPGQSQASGDGLNAPTLHTWSQLAQPPSSQPPFLIKDFIHKSADEQRAESI